MSRGPHSMSSRSLLARYARLYLSFLVQRLKVLLEYRLSFFIGAGSTMVIQAAGVAGLWVVLERVPSLGGWSFDQLLLLYGLLLCSRSIEHTLADNLWTVGHTYIRSGAFDRFLLRPIDPLFHLLADRFNQDGVGGFILGVGVVSYAWVKLALPVSVAAMGLALLAVISGGAIFIALNLLTATTAFWVVDSVPTTRAVHELHELAKYPLTIYGRWLRMLLTWVIPYGFASFYPASALLGHDAGTLAWGAPVVALVLSVVAYRFWRFGLTRYAATGS